MTMPATLPLIDTLRNRTANRRERLYLVLYIFPWQIVMKSWA